MTEQNLKDVYSSVVTFIHLLFWFWQRTLQRTPICNRRENTFFHWYVCKVFSWLCIQVSANQHMSSGVTPSWSFRSSALIVDRLLADYDAVQVILHILLSILDTCQSLFTSAKSLWSLLSTRNWDTYTGELKSDKISHVPSIRTKTASLCQALVW